MGMNEGQLYRLHGSTEMRVENRVRVGDRRVGEPGVAHFQSRYNSFFLSR